jgi:hypothetical protein
MFVSVELSGIKWYEIRFLFGYLKEIRLILFIFLKKLDFSNNILSKKYYFSNNKFLNKSKNGIKKL